MTNDDVPHDWDPEKEKRQVDPDALARTWVRAAVDEQRKIEEEKELHRPLGIGARVCPVPPSPPPDLQLAVHSIQNGFVVIHVRAPVSEYGGPPPYVSSKAEEYAADQAAVHAILLRVLREFFLSIQAPGDGLQAPGPMIGAEGPPPTSRRPGDPG